MIPYSFFGGDSPKAYTTYEDGTDCSKTSAHKIVRRKITQKKEYNFQNKAEV
jgi:hypothetical protein